VPPLVVKNVQTSVVFAVVVLTGTELFGHLTDAGQVILLPAVASLVKNKVKEDAPAEGLENVKVQLPVKVAVTKFPLFKFIVAAVEVFPTAFTSSPTFTSLELLSIIVVPDIWNAIYFKLFVLFIKV
jgi:hypothetical protein